jgi:hypothetical protein
MPTMTPPPVIRVLAWNCLVKDGTTWKLAVR